MAGPAKQVLLLYCGLYCGLYCRREDRTATVRDRLPAQETDTADLQVRPNPGLDTKQTIKLFGNGVK